MKGLQFSFHYHLLLKGHFELCVYVSKMQKKSFFILIQFLLFFFCCVVYVPCTLIHWKSDIVIVKCDFEQLIISGWLIFVYIFCCGCTVYSRCVIHFFFFFWYFHLSCASKFKFCMSMFRYYIYLFDIFLKIN